MKSQIHPALFELATAIYDEITSAVPKHANLWPITDVFDNEDKQIWFDDTGHVTLEGNQLVAQEMLAIVKREVSR